MDPFAQAAADMAGGDLGQTVSYRAPRGGVPWEGLRLILGESETDGMTRGVGVQIRKIGGFLHGLSFRPERDGTLSSETEGWKIENVQRDPERTGYILDLAPLNRREEV